MRTCVYLAVLCLLAAQDPKPETVKAEVARHQGTWRVVSSVREGKEAPQDVARSIERVVEGDRVVWKREGKNFAGTKVVLDPTRSPKTIDVIPEGGPNRDKRVLGIYKLEGDTLTICMAEPDKDRPKSFEAPEGSGFMLMKFERQKSEK
jgi:uncharacterized protein (TIGR03067 family)